MSGVKGLGFEVRDDQRGLHCHQRQLAHLRIVWGLGSSQVQNLALMVSFVPHSLDSKTPLKLLPHGASPQNGGDLILDPTVQGYLPDKKTHPPRTLL